MSPSDLSKPLFSLTVGEFLELQKGQADITPPQIIPNQEKTIIKGIHGLAKFLKVSPVTAQSIKNSGRIPFSQIGRTILFDGEAVLKAMSDNKPKKR